MDLNLNISNKNAAIISIIIFVISLLAIFYILNKNKDNTKNEIVDMPYYLRGFFYKGRNFSHIIIISIILKLIKNNNISLEKSQYSTKSKKIHSNFIFKKLSEDNLDKFEEYLMDILFASKDEISTRELNSTRIKEPDYYNSLFTNFLDVLDEKLEELELKVNKSMNSASLSFLFAMLNLFSFLILIYNEFYISFINLALSALFFLIAFKMVNTFTKKGVYNYNYLKELEKSFNNFKISKSDVDFLTAFSFNINKSALKNLNSGNFDFYFQHDDFYKTIKTSLVGDHFLIK